MDYILAIFNADWADEFDVFGFKIFSAKKWVYFQNLLGYVRYPYEWYFGTNEYVDFSGATDVLSSITPKKITMNEAKLILSKFRRYKTEPDFGHFPEFEATDEFYEKYGDWSQFDDEPEL